MKNVEQKKTNNNHNKKRKKKKGKDIRTFFPLDRQPFPLDERTPPLSLSFLGGGVLECKI